VDALRNRSARCVVVVNPEITSGHNNFELRDFHFIFGDACTALVLERAEDAVAAAPWEVLAHARESRLVVIAGGFDELQREALLHTVANRHPGLPVVSLEPADTPVG